MKNLDRLLEKMRQIERDGEDVIGAIRYFCLAGWPLVSVSLRERLGYRLAKQLTPLYYERFPHEFENRCWFCGGKLHKQNKTRDHLLPRSKGGGGMAGNQVPCCRPCNAAKGSYTLEEFRAKRYSGAAIEFYAERAERLIRAGACLAEFEPP